MAAAPFVLVPGYWLGGWAWERVAPLLRAAGRPGQHPDAAGPGARARAATARGSPWRTTSPRWPTPSAPHGPSAVLVAHSGAGKLATAVLDREPGGRRPRGRTSTSGPAADGLAEPLPEGLTALALPPFEGLEASLDGLSEADLQEFRERAVPHPAAVVREPLRLHDPARRAVPATLVCCSLPAATVRELAAGGHPMFAEVAELAAPDGGRPADGALADVEPARRARRGAAGGRRRRALG